MGLYLEMSAIQIFKLIIDAYLFKHPGCSREQVRLWTSAASRRKWISDVVRSGGTRPGHNQQQKAAYAIKRGKEVVAVLPLTMSSPAARTLLQ